MKKPFIIATLLILASPAFAQQRAMSPSQPSPFASEETEVKNSYELLGIGVGHLATKMIEQINTLQKRIADIEAYGKACGDKPGCFIPVPAADAPK